MPAKWKGAVVVDKNEAPPAKGEKQIKKEISPTVSPDQSKTGETVTPTRSYDDIYKEAVFELLKKNWDSKNDRCTNPDFVNKEIDRLRAEAALRKKAAEDKCAAPPLPPSEKDNFAEIEVSLRNQRSWFLKQNEELLKLLDCLHKQEYDEVVQEEEILDRISDFTLVLFEYVKTLKKRKGRVAVCV